MRQQKRAKSELAREESCKRQLQELGIYDMHKDDIRKDNFVLKYR